MFARFLISPLLITSICAPLWLAGSEDPGLRASLGGPVRDFEPMGDLTAHYRVLQWTVEQGLPQNHVTCLRQTSDGYVWIGTVFGLVRYDGARFSVFEKASLPLLEDTDDHVEEMTEDNDKALWVCMKNGLLRAQDHQWKAFVTGHGSAGSQPTGVCPSKNGGVWVGFKGVVSRYTEEGMQEELKIPKLSSVRKLLEDEDGNLWFADRYQVMCRSKKTGVIRLIKGGTTPTEIWVHYLTQDLKGRICFGGKHGCYRMQGGEPVLCAGWETTPSGIKTNEIFAYQQDLNGRTWLASKEGLQQVIESADGGEPVSKGFHQNPGLHDVKQLMLDAEGNLWAGTAYDGVFYLQERRFATLRATQQIKDRAQNEIWTVCEDQEGAIWFGTSQDLFRWKKDTLTQHNSLTHYPPPLPHGHGQIFSLWPDPKGFIWVGYAGYGLFKLKDELWEEGPLVSSLPGPLKEYNIRALYRDRANVLWFSSWEGLHHYKDGALTQFTTLEGLPSNDVRAILEDRKGTLWIGTSDAGLSLLKDGLFTNFNKTHGLGDNSITCFLEDQDGSIWIGTAVGLTRYKDGKFKTLTRREGLYDNLVNCLLQDENGFFWISCNRGIYRISRQEANAVLDGRAKLLSSMPFGEADGLLNAETNGGSQPAGWHSQDGSLWFPCAVGVVQIDPNRVPTARSALRVVVEQVRANGDIRFGDGMRRTQPETRHIGKGRYLEVSDQDNPLFDLKLAAGTAEVLEIRYTANSFAEPSRVRFQYRLDGHDQDWQEPTDRRITHYTNLKPGHYRFRTRASNGPGSWGEEGQALSLTLAPFFYETPWFYVLCGLFALLIAAGVQSYRLYIQRHILQLEKQHALENERTRIAKDMHDDIGARLTQLGMISELAEAPGFHNGESRTVGLPKVSILARDAVRSLDEIIWAVTTSKNSLDQLAGYLVQSAQDLISPSGLRFELEMPQHIPALPMSTELRHNVFLVAKEALNNAVKHSRACCVRLEMHHDSQRATLIISDDGRGFSMTEAAGAGNGLANMQKRAENVGAAFQLSSQPGQGTRVEIRFPLNSETL